MGCVEFLITIANLIDSSKNFTFESILLDMESEENFLTF